MTTAQFHRNYAAWLKYEELSKAGKKVSLDINTRTGELVARYTHNHKTGSEGNGSVPDVYTAEWVRIRNGDRRFTDVARIRKKDQIYE